MFCKYWSQRHQVSFERSGTRCHSHHISFPYLRQECLCDRKKRKVTNILNYPRHIYYTILRCAHFTITSFQILGLLCWIIKIKQFLLITGARILIVLMCWYMYKWLQSKSSSIWVAWVFIMLSLQYMYVLLSSPYIKIYNPGERFLLLWLI